MRDAGALVQRKIFMRTICPRKDGDSGAVARTAGLDDQRGSITFAEGKSMEQTGSEKTSVTPVGVIKVLAAVATGRR